MSIEFKEIEIESYDAGKVNFVSITGKLEKSDYDLFVPMLEAGIKAHSKINLLIELHDFHGWSAGAAWEDTKFGVRHFNDIQRLAIVGDHDWEKNLARFVKVFSRAKVKYFDKKESKKAHQWVSNVE